MPVLAPERAHPPVDEGLALAVSASPPSRSPAGASGPAPARPTRAPFPRRAVAWCAAAVVGSLLAVVGANAYLTQGQVRLTRLQQELTVASGRHRNLELRVASLSNPGAVVSQAERHGLSAPTHITDLPQVTVPPATTVPAVAGQAGSAVSTHPTTGR